jgi:RNA polymerase sigma-70 factor (ECF subfamily)
MSASSFTMASSACANTSTCRLLGRLGRRNDARVAYDRALALTGNPVEQEHLARRRREMS